MTDVVLSQENIGFRNVLAAPSVGSDKVPDLLFAVYQGMFAAITVALAVGAVAERGRMLPCVVCLKHFDDVEKLLTFLDFHVYLVHSHLRRYCLLDMELIWLGLQDGRS